MEELTADMQYYGYYREAYGAVLDGMVGEYEIERPDGEGADKKVWKKVLRAESILSDCKDISLFGLR